MFLDKRDKPQRLQRLKRKENLPAAECNVSGLKLNYIWTEKKTICDAFLVCFIFINLREMITLGILFVTPTHQECSMLDTLSPSHQPVSC